MAGNRATTRPTTTKRAEGDRGAGRPTTGRPTGKPTGRSTTGRPATGKPATGKPATGKPATGKPATGKPTTGKPATTRTKPSQGERLQKVLARAGVSSRREAETMIAAGRVRVDGRVVSEPGTRIDPESARIEVDGSPVAASEHVYVVMNKPDEMVCTPEPERDANGRPTVSSLLTALNTRVFAVGRLDFHTRGALILTNDGALAEALLHQKRAVPRTYHVKLQGRLDEDALASLHAGVVLDDGARTRPALEVELVKATRTNTWVQMTISQELPRQLRRMGESIGHSVLKMIRVAFAGITADGLREGQWRRLREDEIAGLRAAAGQRPAKGLLALAQA
ncbi:MAG: pseudouridine synthase, partial [Myxococcales bacterium]|nr:pseudouridine synthase [Myxococcales bacterium]